MGHDGDSSAQNWVGYALELYVAQTAIRNLVRVQYMWDFSGSRGKGGKKGLRRQEAERTMGPPMVVEVQMLLERPVDVGHPQLPVVEGPELTAGGGMRPVRRSRCTGAVVGAAHRGRGRGSDRRSRTRP